MVRLRLIPAPILWTRVNTHLSYPARNCLVDNLAAEPSRFRYNIYKDHITLEDYEIKDGMGLELYYN